jgi:hypothetical protein
VCKLVEDSEEEDSVDQVAIPGQFEDWLFAAFFGYNMHDLFRRRLKGQGR